MNSSHKLVSYFKKRILLCSILLIGFSFLTTAQKAIYSDSISVNFFLLDECRICQYYGPFINEYQQYYSSDEISFKGYFPNFSSKKENIIRFKNEYNIQFDLNTDYFKKQSRKFDLEVLPTVVIYDEKNEVILYKGRIDNRFYGVGKQRQVTSSFDLKSALQAIHNQELILERYTTAIGCFINFADNISSLR